MSDHVRPAALEGRHLDERCVAHVMSRPLRDDTGGRGILPVRALQDQYTDAVYGGEAYGVIDHP